MSQHLFALGRVKNVIVVNSDEGEITDMYIQLNYVMSEDTRLADSQLLSSFNFIKSENVNLCMCNEPDYPEKELKIV